MDTIKNDRLQVAVSPLGAELQSIRDAAGREYLWQGDASYWGRRSPVLFPIVGSLWHGRYRIGETSYALPRHGFARDMTFCLVEQSAERLVYELTDTAETLAVYPYRFGLRIAYELKDNRLRVVWRVHNRDRRRIYFSIGGHPAFNVPGAVEGRPLRGALRLVGTGASPSAWWMEKAMIGEGGCLREERYPLDTVGGRLDFDEETFRDDAIVVDRSQLRQVALLNEDGSTAVAVDFEAPAVGIWSPYGKNAPFVCIEPWYGVADREGFDGELKEKYLINSLQPGGTFQGEYTLTVG